MADKQVRFDIDVNAAKAEQGLRQFTRAVKRATKESEDGLDDTATAADKVAKALKSMAQQMDSELRQAAKAAEALGQSLGPELTGRLDVNQVTADLNKMGLSFEDIEAEADTLAASLKEIDAIRIDQAGAGLDDMRTKLDGARGGSDSLTASAQKSRNAMANMVGNAAQDLGAFAGLAGSAGVALGQLAEGAADARNDGEGLGSVLKGVASTAVPIAALGVGVALIGSQMEKSKKEAAELEAQVQRFGDSLEETVGDAESLGEALDAAFAVGAGSPLAVAAKAFQDALDPEKLGEYRTALGELDETNSSYVENLINSGGTFRDYVAVQLEAAGATEEQAKQISEAIDLGDDWNAILKRIEQGNEGWAKSNRTLIENLEALDDVAGSLSTEDLAEEFLSAQRGVEGEAAAVDKAIATTANYSDALLAYIEIKRQQNAVDAQVLAGIEAEDAARQASAEVQRQAAEDRKAAAEAEAEALEEAAKAAQEYAEAIADAGAAIAAIDVDDIGNIAGALAEALDVGDATIDFQGVKADVDDAITELQAYIDEHGAVDWSALLDTSQIAAGDLDAELIGLAQAARDQLQEGIVAAFELGGAPAAQHFLDSFLPQLLAAGLTKGEAFELLGLPDDGSLDVLLKPLIDAEAKADALAVLDAIAGVDPSNPIVAYLRIAVQQGDIEPQIAEIAALLLAQEVGIPVELDPEIPQEAVDAAIAELEAAGVTVQLDVDPTTGERTVTTFTEEPRDTTVDVGADTDPATDTVDAFTGVDRTTGVYVIADTKDARAALDRTAADRVAEFFAKLNEGSRTFVDTALDNVARDRTADIFIVQHGRAVTTSGPTAEPAALTALTAGPTTLAAPTTAPLSISPVTQTPTPASVSNTTVNVRAGAFTSRFDIQRTVARALRQSQRLNGRRTA
jgi:hypothetical protein